MEKVKLITFQHKDIVNELNESGIYRCNYEGIYFKRTPNSYRFLAERTNPPCEIPIFTWESVNGKEVDHTEEQLYLMERLMTPNNEDSFLLVLEVPEEFVLRTNFYAFVGMRCIEEGIDDIPDFREENVLNIDDCKEIQSIIPFIKEEWVKEIIDI